MKAEVAKREIESLDYYLQNHTDDYSEESHTAMMMAISALSENMISIDQANAMIKSYVSHYEEDRPKGHWIGHREHCENLGVMPSGLGAYEWCSNCDCGIDVREWHKNHYNFCPNCGADMRKPIMEKIRCNTCRNNDDELSGECYECIKGIFDHYEPEEVKAESEDKE